MYVTNVVWWGMRKGHVLVPYISFATQMVQGSKRLVRGSDQGTKIFHLRCLSRMKAPAMWPQNRQNNHRNMVVTLRKRIHMRGHHRSRSIALCKMVHLRGDQHRATHPGTTVLALLKTCGKLTPFSPPLNHQVRAVLFL